MPILFAWIDAIFMAAAYADQAPELQFPQPLANSPAPGPRRAGNAK
jgi:hypothetical protein